MSTHTTWNVIETLFLASYFIWPAWLVFVKGVWMREKSHIFRKLKCSNYAVRNGMVFVRTSRVDFRFPWNDFTPKLRTYLSRDIAVRFRTLAHTVTMARKLLTVQWTSEKSHLERKKSPGCKLKCYRALLLDLCDCIKSSRATCMAAFKRLNYFFILQCIFLPSR